MPDSVPKFTSDLKIKVKCYNAWPGHRGFRQKEETCMTNEERQRAMHFIVEQQAQTSAKIDALTETQKRADERWAVTEVKIYALLTTAISNERRFFDRIYRQHKRNYRRSER